MRSHLDDILLPTAAVAAALLIFGLIVWFAGASPVQVWLLLFKGAFGDWYSWQNTLQRAAPLMLTGLAVALPAQAGRVIIGNEGALVVGGVAAAAAGVAVLASCASVPICCIVSCIAASCFWATARPSFEVSSLCRNSSSLRLNSFLRLATRVFLTVGRSVVSWRLTAIPTWLT